MPASLPLEQIRFPDVYDVLYGDDFALHAAQLAFLKAIFGAPPARLLDAGCGTGQQLGDLAAAGYAVVGLDVEPRMLRIAHAKLQAAGQSPELVRGDLRALPFAGVFDGILCLESPLAYLLLERDLAAALSGMRRSLRPGGCLVMDVFDYPGTLGEDGVQQQNRFPVSWGSVSVRESHHFDQRSRIWDMRQEFRIRSGRKRATFSVVHRLRIRSADDYACALEEAGFTIMACQDAYPDVQPESRSDRRIIMVAQARSRR